MKYPALSGICTPRSKDRHLPPPIHLAAAPFFFLPTSQRRGPQSLPDTPATLCGRVLPLSEVHPAPLPPPSGRVLCPVCVRTLHARRRSGKLPPPPLPELPEDSFPQD